MRLSKIIRFIPLLLIISLAQLTLASYGSASVLLFGTTVSEREIHIQIGNLPEVTTLSEINGYFRKTIKGVEVGTHRAIIWVKDKYENVGTEGEIYITVPENISDVTVGNLDFSFKEVSPEEVLPSEECIPTPDLNQDRRVNLMDFSIMLYRWGSDNCEADLNKDGVVNFFDFSILLAATWTG